MIPIQNLKLQGYINSSELLAAELRHIISDYKFEKSGGKILWAVDASEMVAYVLPYGKRTGNQMALFDDEDGRSDQIIERYVLDRILFKMKGLVLLPSYGIELEAFASSLRARTLTDLATSVPQMMEELNVRGKKEAAEITRLAHEVETSGRQLTDSELDKVGIFCQNYAPGLLRLANQDYTEPLERFRHLMNNASFIGLNTFVRVAMQEGDEVFERWHDRLRSQRRKKEASGSNFLDALVIATLYKANLLLRDEGKRIQLISRSQVMAQFFREEEELWAHAGGSILRHPRTFSLFHRPDGMPADELLLQLEQRLGSLKLFLDSANTERPAEMTASAQDQGVQAMQSALKTVVESWRASEELVTPKVLEPAVKRPSHKTLLHVLGMISRRDEFIHRVNEQLTKLSETFERENEFLGWLLQIQSEENREIIDDSISLEAERSTVLACTLESMPYNLEFYAPELRKKTILNGKKWGLTWQEALEFLREGFAADRTYERLLAMAFILGALGQWTLARGYCERALEEPERDDSTSHHEGLFFLAMCYRKIIPELPASELRRAVSILREALREKARAVESDSFEDPRYLKELATLMMNFNRRLFRSPAIGENSEPYTIAEISGLFDRAFSGADSDQNLQLQILNNRCYLYAETPAARLELQRALAHLEEFLPRVPVNRVPASVIDTVAFSHFLLSRESAGAEKLAELINQLEKAKGRIQKADKTTLKIINEHIREIRVVSAKLINTDKIVE